MMRSHYFLILFFWVLYSTTALAQKGSWQINLEKKRSNSLSQEKKLVLGCAIAQEMKDYNLAEAQKIATKNLAEAQKIKSSYAEAEAYCLWAEIKRVKGRPLEALAYLDKASAIFEKLGKKSLYQRTQRDKAFTNSTLTKFDSAHITLTVSRDWFAIHEPNTREHAITLFYLGINAIRLGNYKEAMQFTFQAEQIFDKLEDTYNQARAKNNIGLIQKNTGFYKDGLESFNEALEMYEKIGKNQRGTSVVMINIANTYIILGDSTSRERIVKLYQNAYQIAESIQDTIQMVASLEALAKGEAFSKNAKKSEQHYQKGLEIIRSTGNFIEEGYYILRTSDIYTWDKRHQKAIEDVKKALQTFEKYQVWGAIAQAQTKLARLYANLNDFAQSQYYAKQVLINSQRAHDSSMLQHIYNILLRNAIELQNFPEAEQYFKIAHIAYKNAKIHEMLLDTYRLRIRIDTSQKNYVQATTWFTAYNKLRDSLSIEKRRKDLFEMQFKYDIQDQKRENKYLRELNELQKLEAQERKIVIFAITLILAGVVFVVAVLYKNRQGLKNLLQLVREKNHAIIEKNYEIEAQNHNLEKLNLTKDRILSIISHDMRSPLGNLKAVLDLANNGFITLEEQVEMTQKLNKDIGRIHDFLQNLLIWAESQMAGFAPHIEPISIGERVEHIFGVLSSQAAHKKIELQNRIQDTLIVQTDKDILDMVLLNLISNALKFTPKNGKITIHATQENSLTTIAVQDNGVGIAPQHHGKIFGSTRFTTNGTSDEKGTGFGLTLCRDFVKVLGGDITFESKPQEGTTFYIQLYA